jgi:hypothetical protein
MKKIKVLLTVKCRNMRNPKYQRYRFDQTLGSASWMLQENLKPSVNADGLVTTASVWGRMFSAKKSEADIQKITDNLLKRASTYADIDDYSALLEFQTVTNAADEFKLAPVLTSDD